MAMLKFNRGLYSALKDKAVVNGNVYITDLPFITDWITSGLVTDEERTFWNNKVTAYIDHTNDESLILSKLAEPTS